eukprot:Nitzschia sp. Nitz4//scaffold159_size51929//50516//51733//NITZ4_006889-RA/size51929-processed-gene-0.23-mRNA-1//-1//CDS//3329537604//8093//frame0
MVELNVEQVKSVAYQEGYFQIGHNVQSRVISFGQEDYSGRMLVRVNVYYTTGTVGTCLRHPRQGKTQLFRRNVDPNLLRRIFEDPRVHTDMGYQRVVNMPDLADSSVSVSSEDDDDEPLLSEEEELKKHLARLKNKKAAIELQETVVQEALQAIVAERERKEAAERARQAAERKRKLAEEEAERQRVKRARLESEREQRGRYTWYSMDRRMHSHFEKCLDNKCTCFAIGDCTFITLFEHPGWAFFSGLPKLLHNKLNGRQVSLPTPVFKDGKSEWVGPDGLSEELQENKRTVKSVAFGENWDTYFVVYTDGYWKWGGNIPNGLLKLLASRSRKSDLSCVSLGPEGEWFLSANNGRMWWGGLSTSNSNHIAKYRDRITFMDFGTNDNVIIRYS